MKIHLINRRSAFSLIEVLITLLILSFAIIGTGTLMLESTAGCVLAQQQAEALMITGAIVDSVSIDKEGTAIQQTLQYWQPKLEQIFPGSTLTIEQQKLEDTCIYTITLYFALPTLKTFTVNVVV